MAGRGGLSPINAMPDTLSRNQNREIEALYIPGGAAKLLGSQNPVRLYH